MFDDTYYDVSNIPVNSGFSYGDTNAFMIGAYGGARGMVSGVGKLFGFQDEEDMLKEIYETSDFSTSEGRQAAVDKVMRINPEEGNKLQKQLSDAATAEAATVKMEIDTENAQLARVKAMYTPTLQIQYQRDQGPNGQHQAIATWLRNNGIVTDEAELMKITTTAQAAAVINNKIKTGASAWVSDMNKFVNGRQEAYVIRGVYEKAGLGIDAAAEELEQIEMPPLVTTPEVDDQKYYEEGDSYNANDSQWSAAWKKVGGSIELLNGLAEVQNKLFQFQLETFLPKDKKDYEDAEDAVSVWIGGAFTPGLNTYQRMQNPAYQWFKSHKPIHFQEFKKNPVAYYKKHRKEIESAAGYAGGSLWRARQDNTDLFANIPFNLDEE